MTPATQKPGFAMVLGLAVIGLASILTPLPVLIMDGWPHNDDWLAMFQRIEAFRRSFHTGVWYPVWTLFCHSGYGSPYPLFYHRLYTTVGALLAITGLSVLHVVKLLTVLVLFMGGAGMRRLLRVSGAGEILSSAGAVLFVIAPYTRTNWLARGAMAELTAMMLLPWLYSDLCLWWQGKRRWLSFAVGFVLLFHAHAVIAFYFLLSVVGFVLATALPRRRSQVWQGATREWRRVAVAAVILFVGVVPPLLVTATLQKYFNLKVIMADPHSFLSVDSNFQPLSRYFADDWDRNFADRGHDHLSLEVNRFLVVALLVLHLLPGRWRLLRRETEIPLYGFLLAWTGVCLLLQMKAFAWVFHAIPLARFSQFPWRLTAFMTLGAIFLFISACRVTVAGESMQRATTLALVPLVLLLSAWQFGRISMQGAQMFAATYVEQWVKELNGPSSAGEYMLAGLPRAYFQSRMRTFLLAPGCLDRTHVLETFDQGAFRLVADLDAPCRVSLRQMQTPVLDLELDNARAISQVPSETYEVELQPGHSSVLLRPHSFWELLRQVPAGLAAG